MTTPIDGIIPVMLTPFDADGAIDWDGLEALIEWYIANGSHALFAVCQSSEMQCLSVKERVELARFTVKIAAGRVPVVASGHVAETLDDQVAELTAIAQTGIDGLVLVSNRLDPHERGAEAFRHNFDALMQRLPKDMPLGFYECPAPYRRLLSDEEFRRCADSGRFSVLKDVSCEMNQLMRRVEMAKGTPFAVVNANAAIAWPAMKAGAPGFCGIANNCHPDLYRWLYDHGAENPNLAEELATFLVMSAMSEAFGYPAIAKLFHQRIGTFASIRCRVIDYDVRQRFWALDEIVSRLIAGTEHFRTRIADATTTGRTAA